jgi:hypothetical protein
VGSQPERYSGDDEQVVEMGVDAERQFFISGNKEFERLFTPHLERAAETVEKATVAVLGNHTYSFCTESDISWELENMGHLTIRLQEDADTTEEILDACIKNKVDLLIWVHTHDWVTPGHMGMEELLAKLKERNILTAGFHLDVFRGLAGRDEDIGVHPWWTQDYVFTVDSDTRVLPEPGSKSL